MLHLIQLLACISSEAYLSIYKCTKMCITIWVVGRHTLKAQLHGSQFWRQFFLKSASRFQYSNLIGCVHANYDVIVNILGVRYLENRRTRFRATAPLKFMARAKMCQTSSGAGVSLSVAWLTVFITVYEFTMQTLC